MGSTQKVTQTEVLTITRAVITVSASPGGPNKTSISVSLTGTRTGDQWYYQIGSGNLQGPYAISSPTVLATTTAGAHTVTAYVKDSSGNTLDSATDTVTVTADANISGTATYNPITKEVTYFVTKGAGVTKWSYQAVRQSDNSNTGEIFVTIGAFASSGELGVVHDGTWDVTFKSYVNSTHYETDTDTVTVATPFVDITNVEEAV